MNQVLRPWLLRFGCVAMWFAMSGAPQAIERKPLPSFTVTTAAGMGMRSEDLTQEGQWLFVYVRPACAECEAVLRAVEQAEQLVASRLVIVVGSVDEAGLSGFAAAHPRLSAAAWYADPSRSVPGLVKAAGVPFVLGMKERISHWGLVGVLPDAATVGSTLAAWTRAERR